MKLFLITLLLVGYVLCENKYSRSANEKNSKNENDVDFRKLEKPFRMNKLNIMWKKAQQRLTETKLKSLYSDLMIHDKEEITYKRVKSEGGDKEGYKEAELRKKLTNIMSVYGLREHFDGVDPVKMSEANTEDHYINKSLFKDKKLNQLWTKAENSGFTSEELQALREEFQHHQEKIDQYYDLLNNMDKVEDDGYKNVLNEDELDRFNEINYQLENESVDKKDFLHSSNMVREKHRDLRDGFDKLHRITAQGPNNREFVEPKVQGLWRLATASNFTVDELASLKVELQHYESRLLKLRHLHADHASNMNKHQIKVGAGDKSDLIKEQQEMMKKHARKVEKMHTDLEDRILARHSEL